VHRNAGLQAYRNQLNEMFECHGFRGARPSTESPALDTANAELALQRLGPVQTACGTIASIADAGRAPAARLISLP
jgi:hypothetical protein